jgi:hypothetical protein
VSSSGATTYREPAAIGDDLRRFLSLTLTLAITDFKLRFFGSALGYVWTLMRPLLLFGVLYFVFTEVVRFGDDVKHYPVYLLAAIMLFTFFSETTSRGVTSLVERENLLRKVRFPRLAIPLAVAVHALFNLALNFIVVFVFVLASGIEPRLSWLELIPLIALLILFSTGVTMLLSVRALPRHAADLGGGAADPVLRLPGDLRRGDPPGQHRDGGHGQPRHRDTHADAPLADRPERAYRGRCDRR